MLFPKEMFKGVIPNTILVLKYKHRPGFGNPTDRYCIILVGMNGFVKQTDTELDVSRATSLSSEWKDLLGWRMDWRTVDERTEYFIK